MTRAWATSSWSGARPQAALACMHASSGAGVPPPPAACPSLCCRVKLRSRKGNVPRRHRSLTCTLLCCHHGDDRSEHERLTERRRAPECAQGVGQHGQRLCDGQHRVRGAAAGGAPGRRSGAHAVGAPPPPRLEGTHTLWLPLIWPLRRSFLLPAKVQGGELFAVGCLPCKRPVSLQHPHLYI